ncbi:MAG: DUF4231 domain-containing protein [bacterium]
MTPETYFGKRVEYKIDLYFKLSKQSKNRYYAVSATSIILSAIVPVVINLKISEILPPVFQTLLPTVLSLMVTILVSLERLFQFREHWKNYDFAEESLRREKFLFQARTGEYKNLSDQEAFALFVNRFEDTIHRERAQTIEARTKNVKEAM